MSSFNLDVNYYALDDLRKLFTITAGVPITDEELDVKIANIIMNAKNQFDKFEVENISDFLQEAKLKYRNLIDYYNIQYDDPYPLTSSLKEQMINSKFLDKNEHVIIERPETIPMQVKLISIYSNSRDTTKFPHANNFEIDLPQALSDVKRASLFDFNLSFRVVNVSNWYQNTKFKFSLPNIYDKDFEITFPEGQYINEVFADTLSYFMNKIVQMTLGNDYNGVDYSGYSNFHSNISQISGKFDIYNINEDTGEEDKFILDFSKPCLYDVNKDQPKIIYDQDTYWGLGYQIGFNKERYISTKQDVRLTNIQDGAITINIVKTQTISSPRIFDMKQDGIAFLEIEDLNKNDQTSSYGGKVNSFFARIPMLYTGFEQDYGGVYGDGVSLDLENIKKLKIRLRHFNGVLVDCQNQDFDITLAVTCKK